MLSYSFCLVTRLKVHKPLIDKAAVFVDMRLQPYLLPCTEASTARAVHFVSNRIFSHSSCKPNMSSSDFLASWRSVCCPCSYLAPCHHVLRSLSASTSCNTIHASLVSSLVAATTVALYHLTARFFLDVVSCAKSKPATSILHFVLFLREGPLEFCTPVELASFPENAVGDARLRRL